MASLVWMVPMGRISPWVVVLLLARDIAITGLRSIAASEGVVIAAGDSGKSKTALQMVGILMLMIGYPYRMNFLIVRPRRGRHGARRTLAHLHLARLLTDERSPIRRSLRAHGRGAARPAKFIVSTVIGRSKAGTPVEPHHRNAGWRWTENLLADEPHEGFRAVHSGRRQLSAAGARSHPLGCGNQGAGERCSRAEDCASGLECNLRVVVSMGNQGLVARSTTPARSRPAFRRSTPVPVSDAAVTTRSTRSNDAPVDSSSDTSTTVDASDSSRGARDP